MKRHSLTFMSVAAAAGALAAVVAVSTAEPASAAIRCEGNFQITKHGRINTPYCEDNYLAEVAREYGIRVSKQAVRNNVGVKRRVCLTIGYDNRVRDTCTPYLPDRGHRRH